jgi:hypothetical protein
MMRSESEADAATLRRIAEDIDFDTSGKHKRAALVLATLDVAARDGRKACEAMKAGDAAQACVEAMYAAHAAFRAVPGLKK